MTLNSIKLNIQPENKLDKLFYPVSKLENRDYVPIDLCFFLKRSAKKNLNILLRSTIYTFAYRYPNLNTKKGFLQVNVKTIRPPAKENLNWVHSA